MAELPEGYVSHLTPSRIRIKVPAKRHDAAFFAEAKERLSGWTGVERVEVNPLTASILVHSSDAPALWRESGQRNDLFSLADPASQGERKPLIDTVKERLVAFDEQLRQLSGGQGDLRSCILLALLATGIYQALRGNVAAPAVTLLWYAGDALRLWEKDGPQSTS